jgi:hypothetical protein
MRAIAVRKSNPTAGDVHINRPLTNMSVAWMQEQANYIADVVFPVVPVMKQSDLYWQFDRGDWLRALAEKRAPGTQSAGGGFGINTASYFADVWAYHKDVDDQTRANADALMDPDRSAVQFVTQANLTRRELEWATNYFAVSIWGGTDQEGITGSSLGSNQFQFFDESGSLPIQVIRAQKQAILGLTGFRPNTLVLGSEVWNVLQDHADFTDRITAGQTPGGPAIVNRAVLAAVLELDRVLVSDAVINTGPEGGTESTGFILGKSMLLCHSAPSPAIDQPSAGYTYSWTGLPGAGSTGTRIKRFRIEKESSDRVEGEMAWDQKVVASELGRFFKTVIA